MSSWEKKAQVLIEFQDISNARNVGHLMKALSCGGRA